MLTAISGSLHAAAGLGLGRSAAAGSSSTKIDPVLLEAAGLVAAEDLVTYQEHLAAANAASHTEFMTQISGSTGAVRNLVSTQLDHQQQRMGAMTDQSIGAREDRALSSSPALIAHSPSEARDRAALLLLASGNHIQGMCSLYESVNAILYAPVVLARCAVEAASRAAWLAAPLTPPNRRVGRLLTERLHDLSVVQADMTDETRAARRNQRDAILAGARDANLKVDKTDRGDWFVGESRLSATKVMTELLPSSETDRPGLGKLVQQHFSQVVHSSALGLVMPLDRDNLQPLGTRHYTGMLGHSSAEVVTMLHIVAIAFVKATDHYRTLVGWGDEGWRQAKDQFVEQWRMVEGALDQM